jgi:PAS domain-containing protein
MNGFTSLGYSSILLAGESMNITLSAATLTKVINQSSRVIWVVKRDGEVLWASSGAEEFLGLKDASQGRRSIQRARLYRDNIQFRNFADPEDRIDKITSILIDGTYVICRKEQMPDEGDIIFSVIAA